MNCRSGKNLEKYSILYAIAVRNVCYIHIQYILFSLVHKTNLVSLPLICNVHTLHHLSKHMLNYLDCTSSSTRAISSQLTKPTGLSVVNASITLSNYILLLNKCYIFKCGFVGKFIAIHKKKVYSFGKWSAFKIMLCRPNDPTFKTWTSISPSNQYLNHILKTDVIFFMFFFHTKI